MTRKANEIKQLREKLAATRDSLQAAREYADRWKADFENMRRSRNAYAQEMESAHLRYTGLAQKHRESLLLNCSDALLLTCFEFEATTAAAERELDGMRAEAVDRAERLEGALRLLLRDAKEKREKALAICQAYAAQYQAHFPTPLPLRSEDTLEIRRERSGS